MEIKEFLAMYGWALNSEQKTHIKAMKKNFPSLCLYQAKEESGLSMSDRPKRVFKFNYTDKGIKGKFKISV